ncbi:hypothetical protein JCM10908_001675 [Rhodotorula pacifica]|uniref:uncharacterized protein n=1 Tax=Rhodotorula pacifica TaxID=1495444 RepID=UPI00317768EC
MDPTVVPYDPPLRNSAQRHDYPPIRRDSVLHELEDGLERVAGAAGRVEHYAQEVEKGARLGRHLVQEVDDEYGAELQRRSSNRKPVATPPDYEAGHSRGLQRSASSASSKKRVEDPKLLLAEIEAQQHVVGDLFDQLEDIAELRHRLTGVSYTTTELRDNRKMGPPASKQAEKQLAHKIATGVPQATAGLLALYKEVVALPPRVAAAAASGDRTSREHRDIEKALHRINSAFANVLDFVEDRAKEEKRDVADGKSDSRLQARIEEDHPAWYRNKTLEQLRIAKADSKWQTYAKVDPESYTYRWMSEHPFMQLDKAAVSAIDLAEHRIKNQHDEKTGSWALGSLLSRAISAAGGSASPSAKSSKKRGKELAVGKGSRRHTLLSEGKSPADFGSSDSEGGDDLEKQKKKLLKGSAWAVDVSKLPERVPTDDTSGYQESQAELIEDAIDESKTEHLLLPLVSLFWVGIVILYGYYLIARLVGMKDPLGRIDLGKTFGNDRWNDTDTSSSSSIMSAVEPTNSVASVFSIASALQSAVTALPSRRALALVSPALSPPTPSMFP